MNDHMKYNKMPPLLNYVDRVHNFALPIATHCDLQYGQITTSHRYTLSIHRYPPTCIARASYRTVGIVYLLVVCGNLFPRVNRISRGRWCTVGHFLRSGQRGRTTGGPSSGLYDNI